jgi:hypothetical protein
MGFLIKATFWFSLVLLLLPFGTADGDQPAVSPLQAIAAAREAVGDIAGICERKPDVCTTGKSAMHTIAVRAKETARIAAALLEDSTSPAEAPGEAAGGNSADAEVITGSVPAAH